MPEPLEAFRKLLNKVKQNSYQSVGTLTYSNGSGNLETDLDTKQEDHLYKQRKGDLLGAKKTLGTHHSLINYISMFE